MNTLITLAALAIVTVALPARADTEAVTVTVTATAVHCAGLAPDEARSIAREARDAGFHRKAAECFRIAGDHVEADRSLARASMETSAESAKKIAANVDTAKLQARRLREAFR